MRTLLQRLRGALASSEDNILGRSLSINIGGRVIGLLAGFVTSVLLARLLGPADRGLLALLISVSTVALAATAVGQPLASTYFASQEDADPAAIVGNVLLQSLLLAAVVVPLTMAFQHPIADLFGHGKGAGNWTLAAVLVPLTFLDWTISNQLLGMLRFGVWTGLKFVAGIAETIALFVCLLGFHDRVAGGLIATAVPAAVTIVGALWPVLGRSWPRLDLGLMRRMLRYGYKVQIGVMFQFINYRLDVVIMQFFQPLKVVGYYVIAQTVAEFVITIATAFQSSVLPLISHYEGDERQNTVTATSLRHHGILAGVAVIADAILGVGIINLAYGRIYDPAIIPMLILLPGVWFLGMGLVIQSDLGGRGKPGLSSRLAGAAAILTIILDLALIPWLGVYGGAISSVCAYTTFGVSSLVALHRVSGIPLRDLAVPRRSDFMAYWDFVASRLVRRRGRPRPAADEMNHDRANREPDHERATGRPPEPPRDRRPRPRRVTPLRLSPAMAGPPTGASRTAEFVRRHPDWMIGGIGVVLVVLAIPILRDPKYAFILVGLLIGIGVAWRGVSIPLALIAVPPLVDAVVGSDPLPSGGFTLLFSVWITAAVVFGIARGRYPLALPSVFSSLAILASVAILGVMMLRLGVSPDQAYGSQKIQLYAADVLIVAIGAVFAGTDRPSLQVFILALLIVDATGAVIFVINLASGAAKASFDGRYSLSAQEYPINLGRASADGLLLVLYMMIASSSRRARLWAAVAALPLLITLLAAGSRGPVVAFVAGLVTLLGLTAADRRGRRRLGLVGAVMLVAVIVIPFAVPSSAIARALSTVLGSSAGLSSNGRSQLWALALQMFSNHFWLGAGTGAGATLVPGLLYPHNLFLEMATELGVVGLGLILLVLGSFGYALRRCWTRSTPNDRLLVNLVIAMFVTELVNANFSDPIQGNASVWLWGGIAVGLAAEMRRSRRAAASTTSAVGSPPERRIPSGVGA